MAAARRCAKNLGYLSGLIALSVLGCSSDPVEDSPGDGSGTPNEEGRALELDVAADARVFVSLADAAVVETDRMSLDWDLAFEGYNVFTNGRDSGPGAGGAFGPLSPPTFLSDTAPSTPFITYDGPGGAFLRWYAYDGANHRLLSRYHVYGLRDGERYYKLQILTYYGERQGAPVSALYTVRYAEVTQSGVGEIVVASDVDGESSEAECLNLQTGERPRLTSQQAQSSDAWHVCFRRDAISVNGGEGGPRGVEAVDLEADQTDTELLGEIRQRSAETEHARFDAIDHARLTDAGLAYRPDGIASAFSGRWLVPGSEPPAPRDTVWAVIGADGANKYLVVFDRFTGATRESPGRVALRMKAVR